MAKADHNLTRFDPAVVRAMSDGEWYTFEGHPGLRINATKTARTFTYRYRSPLDGQLRQIRVGRWPATPWPKAVARWDDLRQKRDEGADPRLERKAKRAAALAEVFEQRKQRKLEAVTVEKVVDAFLTGHLPTTCAPRAQYTARSMFTHRVIPVIGDRPAHEITKVDANQFLTDLKEQAPQVARLLRSRLGGAWDHAVNTKLLPPDTINPWRNALPGQLKAARKSRFLDDVELTTFLRGVRDYADHDVRDALLLALMLGVRSGEATAMDWDSVDLKRGTWTLHDTKTDMPRTIRLPRQALELLKARGYAFEDVAANPERAQKKLASALREQKCFGVRKKFTPHDLRRTMRTGLSRLGVPFEVAEAAVGHTKGGMDAVYNLHAYEREVGEALAKWCDHLEQLTGKPSNVVTMRRRKT